MRHHACEIAAAGRCRYCDGYNVPLHVLSTVRARTTLGAVWQAARLNRQQTNECYRWFRYGKVLQLD